MSPFQSVALIFLSLLINNGFALLFQEFDPPGLINRFYQRDTYSGLQLQNSETFLWKNNQSRAIGNFTVEMPGEEENILSMAKFSSMLQSVDCTNSSLTLVFKDAPSFSYAKSAWSWVNEKGSHHFVIIIGAGDCTWNPHRLPFVVSTIECDDNLKSATLKGNASDWKSVAHTYDLWVGNQPPAQPARIKERGLSWDKNLDLDFDHPITFGTFKFPIPDATITLDCVNCGTQGQFEFGFHISASSFIPNSASLTLQPQGVSLSISPTLGIAANFSENFSGEQVVATIPLSGLEIPKILKVGPQIQISLGYQIGHIEGNAKLSSDISISVSDSVPLTVDLTTPGISGSSWNLSASASPLTLDAQLSAEIQVWLKAGVELDASALDHDYGIEIDLTPSINSTLAVLESTSGPACSEDPLKHHIGVQYQPAAGVILEAAVVEDSKTVKNIQIASKTVSLSTGCFGFGPTGK